MSGGSAPGIAPTKSVQGADPLHRRVNQQIDRDRNQCQKGGANVGEEEEHRQPRNGEKQAEKKRITWMHALRGQRTLLCALHARIEVPFPPLVERGCATGAQRRANERRRQDQIAHRSLPAHQKSNQRGQKDEKRESRFDQVRQGH